MSTYDMPPVPPVQKKTEGEAGKNVTERVSGEVLRLYEEFGIDKEIVNKHLADMDLRAEFGSMWDELAMADVSTDEEKEGEEQRLAVSIASRIAKDLIPDENQRTQFQSALLHKGREIAEKKNPTVYEIDPKEFGEQK